MHFLWRVTVPVFGVLVGLLYGDVSLRQRLQLKGRSWDGLRIRLRHKDCEDSCGCGLGDSMLAGESIGNSISTSKCDEKADCD